MGQAEDEIRPCPVALPLPLSSLNHVSFVCKSVTTSTQFYEAVLGFRLVKRPSSFDFEGAWLFNYGIGIHLLQCQPSDALPERTEINPRDNHISFQSPDVAKVEKALQESNIKYEKRVVEDGGLYVDQLFFHDPDGYMVEICNCHNLPVIPIGAGPNLATIPTSPGAGYSVTSSPGRFASPKPNRKMEQKCPENRSEITLVTMNASTPLRSFANQKKEKVPTGRENAHDDKRPYFLDIMAFYL
eukprot:PITA_11838